MKSQACRFVGVGVCVVTIGTARERRRSPEKDSEKAVCLWMEQSDMNEEKRSV